MKRVDLAKVAHEVCELARERVEHLMPAYGVGGAQIQKLLVNAYLQGALDGATIEQRRAKSRGRYKTRT